jgi:hypothetical protein
MYRLIAGLLVISLLFIFGCKTKQAMPAEAPASSTAELNQKITNGTYAWDWFSGSGQLKMESPFFSGSGQFTLRMASDTTVWMVIKYLGLEVARLKADPDSVVLINRWERTVDVYSWAELEQFTGFPTDIISLQRLIVGSLPLIPDALEVESSQDNISAFKAIRQPLQIQGHVATDDVRLLDCRFWNTAQGIEIKGRQDNWQDLPEGVFSMSRYWEMKPDPNNLVFLQVQFQNATFNGPLQFPFLIPDHYNRGN